MRATIGSSAIPLDEAEPCAVAFVDGGLSKIDVGLGVPLIVRAGIFRVKQGERDLEKRETFDHFPLMLGPAPWRPEGELEVRRRRA